MQVGLIRRRQFGSIPSLLGLFSLLFAASCRWDCALTNLSSDAEREFVNAFCSTGRGPEVALTLHLKRPAGPKRPLPDRREMLEPT